MTYDAAGNADAHHDATTGWTVALRSAATELDYARLGRLFANIILDRLAERRLEHSPWAGPEGPSTLSDEEATNANDEPA